MSKRAASLNTIQAYLASGDSTPAVENSEATVPSVAAPHAAPGTQPGTTESKEELQRQRVQIGRDRDALKLTQEQQAALTEEEKKSALEQQTDQAGAKLQQVVNYGKFRLEGFRMPGGLFLPISLLFILFLALLPIGGKTRLQWLWEVITGNASLSQLEVLTPVGGSATPTPTPTPTSGPTGSPPISGPTGSPPVVIPPGPVKVPLFTGVEE